jgi:RecA-family ATPase
MSESLIGIPLKVLDSKGVEYVAEKLTALGFADYNKDYLGQSILDASLKERQWDAIVIDDENDFLLGKARMTDEVYESLAEFIHAATKIRK